MVRTVNFKIFSREGKNEGEGERKCFLMKGTRVARNREDINIVI